MNSIPSLILWSEQRFLCPGYLFAPMQKSGHPPCFYSIAVSYTHLLCLRHTSLPQTPLHKVPEQGIQHGAQRNENQHAKNAQEAAAQGHGGQHPDGGQAYGEAYYMGICLL